VAKSFVTTTTTTTTPTATELAGKVIVLDPGHNGGNFDDPSYINQQVWNGREEEACDTTGTETASGYTEAQFNFTVALEVRQDLQAEGATVIMTRASNTGVGPCITQRTAIANDAHAAAAISIHADGGPPDGRGFAILEPVADGPNDGAITSSDELGLDLRSAFTAGTGLPESTYDGVDGLQPRDDLAGVNLTTVPKVFIECGNMQNSVDAALLTDPSWQQKAAAAIAQGLTTFVLQSAQ
jgi:N-acetylmuramoyl-L-alanine amidase